MTAVLMAASCLAAHYVGTAGYALAYGSHATSRAHADSDLDLLVVGAHPLTADTLDRLIDQVITLHHRRGLRVDAEVDHRVKLFASLQAVDGALALGGFTIDPSGNLWVPSLVAEPWFLNSHPFKLRLIFNAVTTEHVFLTGNPTTYRHHRVRADLALGLLTACLLADRDAFTIEDTLRVLTRGPGGEVGKDHLGYLPGARLYSAIRRALAEAALADVITDVDGVQFNQHHDRRRGLLAALAAGRRDQTQSGQSDRRQPAA